MPEEMTESWYNRLIMSLPKPYYTDEFVTIYNGDCRELLSLIPDKSIDLILKSKMGVRECIY